MEGDGQAPDAVKLAWDGEGGRGDTAAQGGLASGSRPQGCRQGQWQQQG